MARHQPARLLGVEADDLVAAVGLAFVNLASVEYARVALRKALRARVVDCVFEEGQADGSYKVLSVYAKKARGLMVRHAIQHRARSVRALQSFNAEGYALARDASSPSRLVFRRRAA